MKIVRTIWGESKHILSEIPASQIFAEEIVFSWGKENTKHLRSLGYNVFEVSKEITDPVHSTHLKHFAHKLEAIKIAEECFDEFLFLDWDVTLAKPIDENFYSEIRKKSSMQCPLYAYHSEYKQDSREYHRNKGSLTEDLDDFIFTHSSLLEKYSWKHESFSVIPCFCFYYVNGVKIAQDLLDITHDRGILACIEEFSLYYKCKNMNLQEYIDAHEPSVIRGKERDRNLPKMSEAIQSINRHIEKRMQKDIYLYHDLN